MENALNQIEEAVREDRDETRKPKPEMIATIDMDNLQEFRPIPVYFN
jgi:hypothetical protein